MDNSTGALSFEATIQNTNFKREVDEMEAKIKGMTGTVAGEGRKMDNTFRNLAAGAAGVFTIAAAQQFRQKLIEVRGEFQKYQAVLTNSLGSQKQAAEAMGQLTDFASKTPFQLNALTSSYVKLVNQGFKPSIEEMRSLGDLASSTGKQFEQLAEAILDAQTGEFERLKEFGVKAAVSGDQITFAFKNVKTTVDNSAEAIRNYILSLGQMEGVKGAMAAISGTLEGQVSNLQDSITSMFNKIGKDSEGFLSKSIQSTAWLVENYEEIGKAIGALIVTYGAYKTAVIVHSAVLTAAANASKGLTLAMQMQMRATLMLQNAQALLNKTMMANPWVALATIIVGAVAAMALFMDKTTAAERAQKDFNDRVDELNGLQEENKSINEELLNVITDVIRADLERVIALGELQKKYPQIFAQYDIESIKLADILKLKRLINEEESKKAVAANEDELEKAQAEVKRLEKLYEAAQAAGRGITSTPAGVVLTQTFDVAGLKTQLDEARVYLSKWETQVQTDRNNIVLANLKDYTTQQIQQEYAQRKAALEKMSKLNVQEITVSGGILEGQFDTDELKRQTAALETELNNRNAKVYDYTELQKYYSDQLIAKQKELDKLQKDQGKMSSEEWTNKISELRDAIKAIESAQTKLFGKTSEVTTDVEKKSFDDVINYKKQRYQEYATWVEAFGKESATKEYAALIAEGETFTEFLQQKIAILEAGRDDLSTKEIENLHFLQVALAEQIAGEKAAAEEKARILSEAEQQITDSLLSDYGGYLAEKLQFERTYLENKQRLTLAIEKATSEKEKQLAMAALDALEKEKQKWDLSTGDREYDEMLLAYKSYEQKRSEITADFSEKRSKATEKGNLELINALNEAEKQALSQLASDELMDSDAWNKLFSQLDQLTVSELLRLKTIIESQFQNLDLLPDDLAALRQKIDEVTAQVLQRNPFKALKEALQDYKKSESKADLNDVFRAIGGSIDLVNGAFQSVIGNLEKMGVTMDDTERVIMEDISNILSGASQLAIGIAERNPLAVIQGSIEIIANGIDLIWGQKDRKILQSIEAQQDAVDRLAAAYDRLQRAMSTALGTDTLSMQQRQIGLLEAQNKQIDKMIRTEYERGDERDDDKLDDLRAQYKENEQLIRDIRQSMTESITDTSVSDLSSQLMDALVSAWQAGEDAAKAFGETAEDVIKNAAINAIKLQFIEKPVQQAIDNLLNYMGHWEGTNFVFDGLTEAEQSAFTQQMQAIGVAVDEIFAMSPSIFEGIKSDDTGTLTGAIKGVSEETASLVAGQMNAIRMNQAQSLSLMREHLIALRAIRSNTDVLPESLTHLRNIDNNISTSTSLFQGTGIKVRF